MQSQGTLAALAAVPTMRGGRPLFPPLERVHIARVACTDPAAYGLHRARWDCRSLQQVVVARAIVDSLHDTTVARILAAARRQPHRRRSWKTAPLEAPCTTRAAKIWWRDERAAWLDERGEVGLCLDETPKMPALARRVPTQPMPAGQMDAGRSSIRATGRHLPGVVQRLGWHEGGGLEAHDPAPFLWALGQLARRYPHARRLPLMMDNGAAPMAHETHADFARHPRLQAFYPPPHASWLNQAA
jgi:hypothetical protein